MKLLLERIPSPDGTLLAVSDGVALRALDFDDYDHRMQHLLQRHYGRFDLTQGRCAGPLRESLQAYFEGALATLEIVQVETGGTAFQREVWAALRRIPPGTTVSYGALATRLGRPAASRAVGLANGANPIAIVVPCHRVIGANGALTGFGGGLERKRWLLDHEAPTRDLFPPR